MSVVRHVSYVLLAAGWTVRLEVCHQLLLLRKHLLENVQLRLQLLYRQLATTRGRGRVLGEESKYTIQSIVCEAFCHHLIYR